eukprot:Gb_23794 [translate_table: standard]
MIKISQLALGDIHVTVLLSLGTRNIMISMSIAESRPGYRTLNNLFITALRGIIPQFIKAVMIIFKLVASCEARGDLLNIGNTDRNVSVTTFDGVRASLLQCRSGSDKKTVKLHVLRQLTEPSNLIAKDVDCGHQRLLMGSKHLSNSPCASCKLLRRRCAKDCVFAPYFPADEPQKFASVHKVFGASNVSKMLQDLPVHQRGDAVSSMVYEANARVRDPVYGCVGAISYLQQQVGQLQMQLAVAQAEIVCMHMQQEALLSNLDVDTKQVTLESIEHNYIQTSHPANCTSTSSPEQLHIPAVDPMDIREPLWT